jgi:uncharacterized phiE125 gp8 family phage protein
MASKSIYQVSYAQKQDIWPLEEVKNYLRVSHDYDDKMIYGLIEAAVSEAESFTGLSLCKRKIKLSVSSAPNTLELKYSPLLEVVSVVTSLAPEENIKDRAGYIDTQRSQIFLDRKFIGSDLEIEYLSGYPENIPRAISHGILLRIAAMYDRSENPGVIEREVKNLYLPFRPFKI